MGSNPLDRNSGLEPSYPDCFAEPSKKLEAIQKRNSEKGKRLCANPNCLKPLSLSNTGKYCFACEKARRLDSIQNVTTRYIKDSDMDFDS